MKIRIYRPEDAGETARLFYDTVHAVNARDYSEKQLNVWAPPERDLAEWNRSFLAHYSLVAWEEERIVGFGDLDRTGYLDRLYVHKDRQGRGIATAICDLLEAEAPGAVVTYASITARPFFEKRGYRVLREQQVWRQGISLTNFVMEKG